jgi:hypothetical protein
MATESDRDLDKSSLGGIDRPWPGTVGRSGDDHKQPIQNIRFLWKKPSWGWSWRGI